MATKFNEYLERILNEDNFFKSEFTISKINDADAWKKICQGTSWDSAHAGEYLKRGPAYLVRKGNAKFALLHPATDAAYDTSDRALDATTKAKFFKMIKQGNFKSITNKPQGE